MAQGTVIQASLPNIDSPAWQDKRWQGRWQALGSSIANASAELTERLDDFFQADLVALQQEIQTELSYLLEFEAADNLLNIGSELHLNQSILVCQQVLGHLLIFSQVVYEQFYQVFNSRTVPPIDDMQGYATPIFSQFQAEYQHLQNLFAQIEISAEVGVYTPNYTFRMLNEQIATDLAIIQMAINQRTDRIVQESLIVADTIAALALGPATQAGYLRHGSANIITYLNRQVEVRVSPYHNTSFVGVPYEASANIEMDIGGDETLFVGSLVGAAENALPFSNDYLAIPHEAAHLLFRQGGLPTTRENLQAHLMAQIDQPASKLDATQRLLGLVWLEELFADTYGCLIAGPISLWSFQTILTDKVALPQLNNLEQHPFPIIRPLIQSSILRRIGDRTGDKRYRRLAYWFDLHWLSRIKTVWPVWAGVDILYTPMFEVAGKTLSGNTIIAATIPLIDLILDVLAPLLPADLSETWTPNWEPTQAGVVENITALYADFANHIGQIVIDGLMPTVMDVDDLMALQSQPLAGEDSFAWLKTQLADFLSKPNVNVDDLVNLALFQGWSHEGPTNVGH